MIFDTGEVRDVSVDESTVDGETRYSVRHFNISVGTPRRAVIEIAYSLGWPAKAILAPGEELCDHAKALQ